MGGLSKVSEKADSVENQVMRMIPPLRAIAAVDQMICDDGRFGDADRVGRAVETSR
jgi:hypothetical protein